MSSTIPKMGSVIKSGHVCHCLSYLKLYLNLDFSHGLFSWGTIVPKPKNDIFFPLWEMFLNSHNIFRNKGRIQLLIILLDPPATHTPQPPTHQLTFYHTTATSRGGLRLPVQVKPTIQHLRSNCYSCYITAQCNTLGRKLRLTPRASLRFKLAICWQYCEFLANALWWDGVPSRVYSRLMPRDPRIHSGIVETMTRGLLCRSGNPGHWKPRVIEFSWHMHTQHSGKLKSNVNTNPSDQTAHHRSVLLSCSVREQPSFSR